MLLYRCQSSHLLQYLNRSLWRRSRNLLAGAAETDYADDDGLEVVQRPAVNDDQ
jgi:hypothetical protein